MAGGGPKKRKNPLAENRSEIRRGSDEHSE